MSNETIKDGLINVYNVFIFYSMFFVILGMIGAVAVYATLPEYTPVDNKNKTLIYEYTYEDNIIPDEYWDNVKPYTPEDMVVKNELLSSLPVSERALEMVTNKYPEMDVNKIKELTSIAFTLWCEDRHSRKAMLYVGSVLMNRVRSNKYPDNAMSVIHQRKQFSCWGSDGNSPVTTVNRDYKQWDIAIDVAKSLMDNTLPRMTIATHYYAYNKVNPEWGKKKHSEHLIKVGDHVFVVMK